MGFCPFCIQDCRTTDCEFYNTVTERCSLSFSDYTNDNKKLCVDASFSAPGLIKIQDCSSDNFVNVDNLGRLCTTNGGLTIPNGKTLVQVSDYKLVGINMTEIITYTIAIISMKIAPNNKIVVIGGI